MACHGFCGACENGHRISAFGLKRDGTLVERRTLPCRDYYITYPKVKSANLMDVKDATYFSGTYNNGQTSIDTSQGAGSAVELEFVDGTKTNLIGHRFPLVVPGRLRENKLLSDTINKFLAGDEQIDLDPLIVRPAAIRLFDTPEKQKMFDSV